MSPVVDASAYCEHCGHQHRPGSRCKVRDGYGDRCDCPRRQERSDQQGDVMAAVEPLTLHCPACSEPINIPASATPGARRDDGAIPVAVGFDRGPALAHIEQHLMQVTQTIFADDPRGRPGNCLQAAVASLLALPLDEVPHFIEHEDWLGRMTAWAGQRGYAVAYTPVVDEVLLGIAYGPSPRGVSHAVVVRDGAIDWDPHPSRAGLLSASGVYEFTKEN